MRIRRPSHRNAHTFLVHVFGRGLDGDRYVVERFRSRPDGQIHPVEAERPNSRKGGRRPRRTVVSAGEVTKMQPERDEIIICTALNLKASGVQLWGLGPAVSAPCATRAERGAGHARPGLREGAGQRPPAPESCRSNRKRSVLAVQQGAARVRPEGLRELRGEAARRRQGPPRQGASPGRGLRRPRSGQVPPRRPSRRQAPPPRATRCGPLLEMRPQPTRGRPFGLRALPRSDARARSPTLCRAQGRRRLRVLRRAGDRWLVASRPAHRTVSGTVVSMCGESALSRPHVPDPNAIQQRNRLIAMLQVAGGCLQNLTPSPTKNDSVSSFVSGTSPFRYSPCNCTCPF